MKDNLDLAVHQTMKLFDLDFPNSFNLLICNLVYNSFLSQKNTSDIFLSYLTEIQAKEEEMNKNNLKIIHMFVNYISKNKSQESNYLIEKMIEQNLIDVNIAKDIDSIYFAHYKTEKENIKRNPNDLFTKTFLENYEKLSKNNWSLHKKYIREGHKPNKIARIIRNDEIEKLQIISSLTHFDYDQFIKPSLYERCSFINQENVALIDYAAFFGSVKCFKYLLINNAKLENTGKYAVAGGNLEIIHLCEQNHSSFEGAYETVIEFHQNDIFKYLYENKLKKINNLNKLVYSCIINANYEILFFLEEEMKISDDIINTAVKIGNLYLVKYFIRKYQIPKNILILASWNNQIDIIKLLVEQTGIDINAKNIKLFCLMLSKIIVCFKIIFGNHSNYLKQHLCALVGIIT